VRRVPDPGEQALRPDGEIAAAALVVSFRATVGTDTDDPRVIELVDACPWPVRCSGVCDAGWVIRLCASIARTDVVSHPPPDRFPRPLGRV
jgi:hypothetical protein